MKRIVLAAVVSLASTSIAFATDIEGVQAASLDQPRVNVHLRRTLDGPALAAAEGQGGDELKKLLGALGGADAASSTINIQAFLDTGASGVMISKITADALGLNLLTTAPKGKDSPEPVIFTDVGVGGGDKFHVSEKLFLFGADFAGSEPDDAASYPLHTDAINVQIPMSSGLLDSLTGGLDVVGMPFIKGKVIVIDPKPVDTFSDTLRTHVLDAAKARSQKNDARVIPKTDHTIRLSYAGFENYTQVTPKGAKGPTMADNPFIGPRPALDGQAGPADAQSIPPVVATYKGKKQPGSWLLDTGAAASMISEKQAAALGVKYVEATRGSASPRLEGIDQKQQFTLAIGGVGGQTTAAGFYLDELIIPTVEGDPLVYKHAPVLVKDITVNNEATGHEYTIDGVFGMNYLVASAHVTGGALPDLGNLTAGPFEAIVIDEPAGTLKVMLKK